MSNPVFRWQILSPEPAKSAAFYEKLFDWKLSRANELGYRELSSGVAGSIAGGVWPAPPAERSFIQLFIEVDDIDASVAKATNLGAQVLVPKSALPDGDVMAILEDPSGLSFGVCQLRSSGKTK
jgi:predicted enzyme related to lactoylglutathione lyase